MIPIYRRKCCPLNVMVEVPCASVSITSSLVMLRSTFNARHSRVYSSTIDSHFSGLPVTVRSNTKSQHQTWSWCSARFTWQAWSLVPRWRFCGTFKPSQRHRRSTRCGWPANLRGAAARRSVDSRTVVAGPPTRASASPTLPRHLGAVLRIVDCCAAVPPNNFPDRVAA